MQWAFHSVVRGDRGYDSVVYRLPAPDGRWVLLSTKSVNSTAFVSHDLYEWAPATAVGDEGLNVLTGEGPHVVDWHGHRWLNCNPGTEFAHSLSRSDTGGRSWTPMAQNSTQKLWVTPFPVSGRRKFDIGAIHQGPLTVRSCSHGR